MSEEDKKLLDRYMYCIHRLTLAEYFFLVENSNKKFTTNDKEYKTLCKLIKEAKELYPQLIAKKINPPIWGRDKLITYKKDTY